MTDYAKIVPCLDVKVVDGVPCVVKGVKFVDLKRQGDPVELQSAIKSRVQMSLSFWTSPPRTRAGRPWWMWPAKWRMLWIYPLR